MQRLRVSLTIGLVAASAFVAGVWAQGRNSAGTLTGQDYTEIQQLYARYAQGTDFGNAEMWLDVFTKDAIFRPTANQDRRRNASPSEFKGRDEMTKWRMNNFANRRPNYQYRHWTGSWVITPTGPGKARGRVYWMAFDPSRGTLTITDTGYYEDVYEKTGDGWRIKERTAYGDPQPAS
jgi:3-phenylpropionate/cinnamic acid dioxygenase small subunit